MRRCCYSALWLLTGFAACGDGSSIHFRIRNQTGAVIDSLSVHPLNHPTGAYLSLAPNDSAVYITSLRHVPKTDGSYLLRYRLGDSLVQHPFGYYTNGWALEEGMTLDIGPDSLRIRDIRYKKGY